MCNYKILHGAFCLHLCYYRNDAIVIHIIIFVFLCCEIVLFQGKSGLGGSNELLGSCNTSMILSAVRHGISDECNDSSSDSGGWTLFGIMATSIANV